MRLNDSLPCFALFQSLSLFAPSLLSRPAFHAANTGTGSFKVGVSSASAQRSRKNGQHLRLVGVKATLASGKAQSARKEAHVQAGQIHREKIIKEARVGRS